MDHAPASHRPQGKVTALVASPWGLLVTVALAGLGLYLFMTHTGHVLSALPYLLLLACPLMHLFMHHGHGHDDRHNG